jgi:hypothetical protein
LKTAITNLFPGQYEFNLEVVDSRFGRTKDNLFVKIGNAS